MQITPEAEKRARHFLENEKQFHLGMLPTEQANPKTKGEPSPVQYTLEALAKCSLD